MRWPLTIALLAGRVPRVLPELEAGPFALVRTHRIVTPADLDPADMTAGELAAAVGITRQAARMRLAAAAASGSRADLLRPKGTTLSNSGSDAESPRGTAASTTSREAD